MQFIGFTIGPISETLAQAKKLRDHWAGSFFFSLVMKELIHVFQMDGRCKLIIPWYQDHEVEVGSAIGTWPDRGLFEIFSDFSEEDSKVLVRRAIKNIENKLQIPHLDQVIYIYGVNMTLEGQAVHNTDDLLLQFNDVFDNLERTQFYRMSGEQSLMKELTAKNGELIKERLYPNIDPNSRRSIFIEMSGGGVRLPSIIEIATIEFSGERIYKDLVNRMSDTVKGRTEHDREEDDFWKELSKAMKDKEGKVRLAQRHKYYALVHADGDNIGAFIKSFGGDLEKLRLFSSTLSGFSSKAAKKIADYGGLPIYAGGDDLMFVAPLSGKKGESILTLIQDLRSIFGSMMGSFKSSANSNVLPSISFGVAMAYYKHPMNEAREDSVQALFGNAKSFTGPESKIVKNAVCLRLIKHSGQPLEVVLGLNSDAWHRVIKMMDNILNTEVRFFSSLMYKLDDLRYLLFDACKKSLESTESSTHLDNFFKNHFNETVHLNDGANFFDEVKNLCLGIMKELPDHAGEKTFTDKLYGVLRLIQFFNTDHHE